MGGNMTTKLTYAQLADLDPCGLEGRKALWGRRKALTAVQALEAGASVEDILWVAGRLGRKDLCVRFSLMCAQRVAANNPDPRVQAALDAVKAWLENPCEETESAARSAESAAWSAARSAARSAESAARSAEERGEERGEEREERGEERGERGEERGERGEERGERASAARSAAESAARRARRARRGARR
jgi:hypothetical protein